MSSSRLREATRTSSQTTSVIAPATAGSTDLLRVVLATVAGRHAFRLDELADLRVALEEAWSDLLEHEAGQGTVTMRIDVRDGLVEVALRLDRGEGSGSAVAHFRKRHGGDAGA